MADDSGTPSMSRCGHRLLESGCAICQDYRTMERCGRFADQLREAAEPFAHCTHGWEQMGYGSTYTCLDCEIDIANPEHHTDDWWPHSGPCKGCELARVLGREGKGTATLAEREQVRRETHPA